MALAKKDPPLRIQFQTLCLAMKRAAPSDFDRLLGGLDRLFKHAVEKTLACSPEALPLERGKAAQLHELIESMRGAEEAVTQFNAPSKSPNK